MTPAPTLGTLTVKASAREGGQTVTVTEKLGTGVLRRYLITDAGDKPTVDYDTVCASASGWTAFPENGQVTGTADQVVTVVDCTEQGANARAKGEAVLPAPTPAQG